MRQSSLHVAIIMDGNGRWASLRGLPRLAGHRAGAEALRAVIEAAPGCGIAMLTTYAFSSDNWKRPSAEVSGLMMLIAGYLEKETSRFRASGVRVSVIGRRDRLPGRLLAAIEFTESATRNCDGLHLQLAIDYSARETILRATERLAGVPVTMQDFEGFLGQSKPVDLLIRTGGEQRLSDFLLWECAYAELVFAKCMWPEFNAVALGNALVEFRRRDRRFGAIESVAGETAAAAGTPMVERWLR